MKINNCIHLHHFNVDIVDFSNLYHNFLSIIYFLVVFIIVFESVNLSNKMCSLNK